MDRIPHSIHNVLEALTHPTFKHMSEQAKLVLTDYDVVQQDFNKPGSRPRTQILDSASKEKLRSVSKVICMGLGSLSAYRTVDSCRANAHYYSDGDAQKETEIATEWHENNYKRVLYQVAMLEFICDTIHDARKSLHVLRVEVYDGSFNSEDLQVIKHVLRRFHVVVKDENCDASHSVKSDTFWYTPGMDPQGVPRGFNGGGAPFIYTWVLEYPKIPYLNKRALAEAQEHLDALQKETDRSYRECVAPEAAPMSGVSKDESMAFSNHGLYERK